MKLQLKRSNVLVSGAAKEPTAAQLDYGELAINYSTADAAIFLKDSSNNVIRIAGVHNIADDGLTNVPTTTSPPTSPTPEAGNLWYNSEDGRLYVFYVDDNSSQWVDASPDTWQTTVIPDTTNPAHQAGTLDDRYVNINGDTLTGALLLDNAAAVATPDLAFDGDLNTGIFSPGADSLAITTAGTQRVTVDSSGNVGIGTSNPAEKLHIAGAVDAKISIDSSSLTGTSVIQFGNSDDNNVGRINYDHNGDYMTFRTNGAERMRIDSLGRVGIRTNSASSYGGAVTLATVSTGNNALSIVSGTISDGTLFFADGTSGDERYRGIVKYSHSTDSMQFTTAASERMRIDSSGRLLVGTTSASGSSNAPLQILAASDADAITVFGRPNDDISQIKFIENDKSTELGELQYKQDHAVLRHRVGYLRFETGGTTERMRILSSGGLTFNGDTAQANALDDYEEGTFTPQLKFGGGNTGMSMGTNSGGSYTKVGRMVYAHIRVELSARGSSTGSASVAGLPFTAGDHQSGNSSVEQSTAIGGYQQNCFISTSPSGKSPGCRIMVNTNTALLSWNDVVTGNYVNMSHSAFDDDATFGFDVVYQA